MPIHATITQYADITTLRLGGDLSSRTRPDLYRACMLATKHRQRHLTIDLTDVTTVDGPAIALLENLAAGTLAGEGDAILIAPQHDIRAVLAAHPLRADILVMGSVEDGRKLRKMLQAPTPGLTA